jgi:hypothetical protein
MENYFIRDYAIGGERGCISKLREKQALHSGAFMFYFQLLQMLWILQFRNGLISVLKIRLNLLWVLKKFKYRLN